MRRLPLLPEASVLAITFAWGLSFVVIPRALDDCGPVTLTALRMIVGTVAALLLLRPRLRAADRRTWRFGLLGGVFLTGGYLLQTYGLRTAGSGDGGFLTAFSIVLVPVLEALVHGRRPAVRDLVLLAVASAGITLLAAKWGAEDRLLSWDAALIALSSLFWAAQIVTVGHIAEGSDAGTLATIQVGVVAVAASAWLAVTAVAERIAPGFLPQERPVVWSADFAGSVFFLGYVTCALAFSVQAWVQRTLSPTRIAILFSPEPLFAALAGVWFRDESLGGWRLAGAALVLVAVALALVPSRHRGGGEEPVG